MNLGDINIIKLQVGMVKEKRLELEKNNKK